MNSAAPRRRLSRAFLAALGNSPRRRFELARQAGFPHAHILYHYANAGADAVPATPLMVSRLSALATLLNFPPEEIFDRESAL
jgi:hypothetical protein